MKLEQFDEIYREYFRDVFLYLMSLSRDEDIAEELTQETFVKAMSAIGKFRGECSVRVWLCQIAKNEYLLHCRKNRKIAFCDPESEELERAGGGGVRFEDRLEDGETALDIHKALHTLDDPYKEVFSLRTFGELTFKQIAEVFGRTESWARVTYHRARLKLIEKMEKIEKQGDDDK